MRILFIILLFCSTAYGQHYVVIPSKLESKVKAVSARFYQLSRPLGTDTTKYQFTYIKHPTNDSLAIIIDTNLFIPKGSISATQVTNYINELYPSITTTQRNQIINYINSNNLLKIARLILTARIRLWTEAELKARGWMPDVTL
jgi:hypothetical protein